MDKNFKPFDQQEVESIRLMLESERQEGKTIEFEIKVDDAIVIHRTGRTDRFDQLYNFINENSKKLVINIYPQPGNYKKSWYKYRLGEEEKQEEAGPKTSLNGTPEVQAIVKQELDQYRERTEAQRVQEKLQETVNKLNEAEAYIDELTEKINALQAKPNHLGAIDLGKLAGTAVREIALSYPKMLEKVPVLNGIAKAIQDGEKEKPDVNTPGFEGEVSFKTKSKGTTASPTTGDEETQQALTLLAFIKGSFDAGQQVLLSEIIQALAKNPEEVETVAELLNIELDEEDEKKD